MAVLADYRAKRIEVGVDGPNALPYRQRNPACGDDRYYVLANARLTATVTGRDVRGGRAVEANSSSWQDHTVRRRTQSIAAA